MTEKRTQRAKAIPKRAKAEIKRRNIELKTKNRDKGDRVKYEKKHYAEIVLGYDMLENLMLVRTYIQKKYEIRFKLLELLLFLAPKQFFTQADYKEIAKNYTYGRIDNIVDSGFVKIMTLGESKGRHLYTLSPIGKTMIAEFYKCLFGEKKIPTERLRDNPLASKSANIYIQKKFALIKQMNQLPVSETKRQFFE
jgi:hypothetical protein